jgi:hypothetical protein
MVGEVYMKGDGGMEVCMRGDGGWGVGKQLLAACHTAMLNSVSVLSTPMTGH